MKNLIRVFFTEVICLKPACGEGGLVAQVSKLLYRRLPVGHAKDGGKPVRIRNPRYSRMVEVCATTGRHAGPQNPLHIFHRAYVYKTVIATAFAAMIATAAQAKIKMVATLPDLAS